MKKKITILSLAIVGLLLSIALTPPVSAGDGGTIERTLEIAYEDENGNVFFKKIIVSEEQLQAYMNSWSEWEYLLKQIRSDGEIDDQEMEDFEAITVRLLEEFKELTYDEITGEYSFPPINIPTYVHDFLFTLGPGARIFSIGRGRAWLPFNRQGETFVGKRYLPIIIWHNIGFTRVKFWSLFPLSRIVMTRMFKHRSFTMGFTGLYINIGKRYLDRPAGPIILIGRVNLISLGDDTF